MKNQANFTPHAIETWAAALSVYKPEMVNVAVLKMGLSDDPFPDLGKVMRLCEVMRRSKEGTTPEGGVTKISNKIVKAAAENMGLELPKDFR